MSSAPWLLTSHGSLYAPFTKQCLYNVADNRCYHAELPLMDEKRVVGSTSHGWLVLAHFWDVVGCLWNPESGATIELPPLEGNSIYEAVILTKPPTELDCHVILTGRDGSLAYCRIGDDALKIINNVRIGAVTSSGGRIYAVQGDSERRLVSIELVGSELEVRPMFDLEGTDKFWSWSYGEYLVESEEEEEGELLLVYKTQPSINADHYCGFRVFRLNLESRVCEEVESIGDRTLFVADFGDSFCCPAAANKTKPNSVYYAREEWRSLYIYSMDDGRTTTKLPSPAINRRPFNFWIQHRPSHHLLTSYFRDQNQIL